MRGIFWAIFANKCHASAKCALAGPDLEKYEAEIERRRQIGLTIDPAIGETTYWFSDIEIPTVSSTRNITVIITGGNTLRAILGESGFTSNTYPMKRARLFGAKTDGSTSKLCWLKDQSKNRVRTAKGTLS